MDSEIEKEEAQARLDSQGESVSSLASSRDVLEKRAALDAAQEAAGAKTNDILEACKWSDLSKLKALAESTGGFLTDDLRRLAWPILLGVSVSSSNGKINDHTSSADDWKELAKHRDEEQVELDVNRSFVYYPNDQSDAQLEAWKSELSHLIVEVLRRHPYLCYFQGYHDICQVFLLVLQPALRADVVSRLSVLRIRDFMLPSLSPTTAQLKLLPDILGKADPELRRHIATIEPFYALAGTLTMYSHNIEGYRDIARLFDVFLAREPVFTIYLFAQIVVNRHDEIMEIDDPDMLQVVLAKVPRNMDLDALIVDAVDLFDRFPPETLRSWRHISAASSLKTARCVETSSKQTVEQGRVYFEEQAKEVRWTEMRDRALMAVWRYRRPIKAVGVAATVALVGVYLRKHPHALHYIMSLFGAVGRT